MVIFHSGIWLWINTYENTMVIPFITGYTLWLCHSLLLKMAIEIVDFPMNSMVDLSIAMLNYQRVF